MASERREVVEVWLCHSCPNTRLCFFQGENQLKPRALTLATGHLRHQNATPDIPGPSFFPNIF